MMIAASIVAAATALLASKLWPQAFKRGRARISKDFLDQHLRSSDKQSQ